MLLKHWMDDRIPDPFVWEFLEGDLAFSESPEDALQRIASENIGIEGLHIKKPLYTWSTMVGESQCIGITFLCEMVADANTDFVLGEEIGEYQWVSRRELPKYIENSYVLKDLKGVAL